MATYDIFPTVLKLAGVPLPPNRVFDGVDMGPILFAPDPDAADSVKNILQYRHINGGIVQTRTTEVGVRGG
eukprot:COSAG01_NODE_32185_length_585_cov_0.767490_1_plen_70_part_10